jgi:hypothetical protein
MIATPHANTDWFHQAKWGVMLRYLAGQPSFENEASLSPEEWNRQVEAFDAHRLLTSRRQNE